MVIFQTREEWLSEAAVGLRSLFDLVNQPLIVPIRLSMGFPSSRALSPTKRTIGQCWSPEASTSGHSEILISPLLDDPTEILGVVAHEMGHAALGQKIGHKAPFARLMKSLGLDGKATATYPGELFKVRVEPLLDRLGKLPHSRLDPTLSPRKKDGIRQIKCMCAECGYVARTTRKWLDLSGPPICPLCEKSMEEQEKA